jgi:hypothetical protein
MRGRAATPAVVGLCVVVNGAAAGATGWQPPPPQVTLDLRVYAYATLEPAEIEAARLMALGLLATAGVGATWGLCGGRDNACGPAAVNARVILVHVVPGRHPAKPTTSGDATPGTAGLRMVRVFRPRLAEMVETLREVGARRSVPQLATVTIGHLAGLTIAHEVGHILGLRHARSGVMQARLGAEEVVAARRLTLAFSSAEIDRMGRALRAEEGALARERPPEPES